MRLRKSSKPKLIEGSWSAMDGASCDDARMVVLREGSKVVILESVSRAIAECLSELSRRGCMRRGAIGLEKAMMVFGTVAG